jgi:hypothetical protein
VFIATAVVVMFIVPRFGWMSLLLFVWLGIPLLRRVLTNLSQRYAARSASPDVDKAKPGDSSAQTDPWSNRAYRAPSAYAAADETSEKPKRRPEYVVGDDGELIEVEPAAEAGEPRRSQSNGSFYV